MGWAAVLVEATPDSAQPLRVIGGVFGTLAGHQTVPRAELEALRQVAIHSSGCARAWSDNSGVVQGAMTKDPDILLKGDIGDLWDMYMQACVDASNAGLENLEVLKTKAHASARHLLEGASSPFEVFGNELADIFSRLAARRGRVLPTTETMIRTHDKSREEC